MQIALGWVLAQKPWTAPIPGTTQRSHPGQNIAAAAIEPTLDDLRDIEEAVEGTALADERYTQAEATRTELE